MLLKLHHSSHCHRIRQLGQAPWQVPVAAINQKYHHDGGARVGMMNVAHVLELDLHLIFRYPGLVKEKTALNRVTIVKTFTRVSYQNMNGPNDI